MVISKVIKKYKINEQPNDFSFWQSKSYEERLEALEQIRKEYNSWRYNAELKDLQFEDCYKSRVQVEIQGLHNNFIDIENLKKNKRANGRSQDLADIENLE